MHNFSANPFYLVCQPAPTMSASCPGKDHPPLHIPLHSSGRIAESLFHFQTQTGQIPVLSRFPFSFPLPLTSRLESLHFNIVMNPKKVFNFVKNFHSAALTFQNFLYTQKTAGLYDLRC